MGRSPCCSKDEVNRGAWTAIEDKTLIEYINTNGEGKWRNLPKKAGLKRCGKSCRLRWLNYLRPGIKRGNITKDEEELIIRLHKLLGNRWSLIAGRLPGRTDNEVKNYWNTIIEKKLQSPKKSSSSREDHAAPRSNIRANSDPGVVWTRPSRCSKVTIPPELHDNDDLQQRFHEPKPMAALSLPKPLVPQFSADCNGSPDFEMDFELDGQFLSDFLGTDFSQLTNIQHGAASDGGTTNEQGLSCPISNQTSFFEQNALHDDSNCLLVDPMIESEFDWVI